MPRQLEALTDELRAHATDEIAAARADYRLLRVVGEGVLVAGLLCTTVANLV